MSESVAVLSNLESLPVVKGEQKMKLLLDNEALKSVLFAFDTGQGLGEHANPNNVVVTCIDGVIDFSIDGDINRLHAGDVVYLAPGTVHAATCIEPAHMQVLMVNPQA